MTAVPQPCPRCTEGVPVRLSASGPLLKPSLRSSLTACIYACFRPEQGWSSSQVNGTGKKNHKKGIRYHARPMRASATAPLRTGADLCKTGSGAGKCAGAESEPVRRRGNHEWTDDQAGRRRHATRKRTEAFGCTPQTTHQARKLRQEPDSATSCARGVSSQCSSRVEEERDKTSCGNHNRGTVGRKRLKQHRHCMIRSGTRPKKVIHEEGQ